jgi:hypothetical protein
MPTALSIITGAMHDLNALGSGQQPTGNEGVDCLTALNQYRDWLGLERGMLYSTVRTVKTLAASTASYTIGSGGSIDLVRPSWIDHATVVLDNTASPVTERPIDVLSDAAYAAWSQKARTGSPLQAIWYNHVSAAGLGTISVLPIPTVGTTQLVLYTPGGELTAFADLTTVYTLPRGFERALRKNLALEISPMFAAQPSAFLLKQAQDSLAAIKRTAVRMDRLRCDPGLVAVGGGWDIESDGYASG